MSLFKVRDIWYRQLPGKWDDCLSHLKVCKLLGEGLYNHFIIVGNFSGILSLYYPQNGSSASSLSQANSLADLCLEYDTKDFIFDIGHGFFGHDNREQQSLVLLHPRKVSVYDLFKTSEGIHENKEVGFLQSWNLNIKFKHEFDKHSFNMCISNFGDNNKLDSICVQMVDGSMHIFGSSGIINSLCLPNTIFAGPLVFLRAAEVFLTISSSRTLYAFNGSNNPIPHSQSTHGTYFEYSNFKIQPTNPDWTLLFGEPVFRLAVAELTSRVESTPLSYVIVLGRRQVFLVSEQGSILSTRRTDFTLRDVCVYGCSHGSSDSCTIPTSMWEPRFILTTETKQILVFKGIQLLWCAQLPWLPITIAMPFTPFVSTNTSPKNHLPRIGTNLTPGLIACLNSDGILSLMYLGTDASYPLHSQSNLGSITENQRDLNYEQLDLEMADLNRRIRDIITHSSSADQLVCQTKPNRHLDPTKFITLTTKFRHQTDTTKLDRLTCLIDVFMNLTNPNSMTYPLESLQLTAHTCLPLIISPNHLVLSPPHPHPTEFINEDNRSNSINRSHHLCTLTCYLDQHNSLGLQSLLDLLVRIVLSLKFQPTLSNLTQPNLVYFVSTSLRLPINLFVNSQIVERTHVQGSYKLTFQLNTNPTLWTNPRLADFLPNLWPCSGSGSTLCLNFPTSNQSELWTIYVLWNAKKYQIRLQGHHPETFGLIIEELLISILNLIKAKGFSPAQGPFIVLLQTDETKSIENTNPDQYELNLGQLEPFMNYLYEKLCQHVDHRLHIATRSATLTVRARHLRSIQLQILTRTKDIIPVCLNGFDVLLETNLNALIRNCQLIQQSQDTQLKIGSSILVLVNLLSFLSIYFTKNSQNPNLLLASNLFQPGRLIHIVLVNNYLEICRGNSTLPDQKCSDNMENLSTDQYLGLEECLYYQILAMLDLCDLNRSINPNQIAGSIKTISTNHILPVNLILQKFQCLCNKFIRFGGYGHLFKQLKSCPNSKIPKQVSFDPDIQNLPTSHVTLTQKNKSQDIESLDS